ncbi:MAG TPA: hypothetical protein VNY05_14330 [Candidatus Acidoferrales bacterium]|jgi:uncharacterized protein (UPF0332 family)|nr:hypothetical protein [Candidatus Acidoferrales bacterium]
MPFAEHLLEQAQHLARREKKRPRQASLRRAVSTAYYALFHLLVSEATRNWKRASQRDVLARAFDHGKMRAACEKKRKELEHSMKTSLSPGDLTIARQLHSLVDRFPQSQEQRHKADYDNSKQWTRTEVLMEISKVTAAFQSWKVIRNEDLAQDFLIYLLVKDR